ncbi:tetratricopeptide repeat protein [Commensalibacter communis]|uniref:tetratricopeptide repeat protein n=1 Tax=Commensalibacter communis TaxID=2972786 RepID=UPI0022FF56B5|nr:hypothetical protein [Commensalibacter communis]CAI3938271.1 unnamed protein product [Commensalibacter communis]CAI3939984.1 unnamed protein product [Commensalibacter communis]
MKLKYILLITASLVAAIPSNVVAEYYRDDIPLLQQQANQGDIFAKIKLADIYFDDNDKEAIQLLNDAIKYGTPKEQMSAVNILNDHEETRKKALKITKKLASKNNIYAQIELGKHYFDKYSDSKNDELNNKNKAMKWLNRAAEHANIPQMIEITNVLTSHSSSDNKYRAKARAIELGLKIANTGDANAKYNMGQLYQKKLGSDLVQAKTWYEKAAQQGHKDAQFELGSMIYRGYDHVKEDHYQGMNILLPLANSNYQPAQCQIITFYNDQQNKVGYAKAIEWAKKAYQNNNHCGVEYLGKIYTVGKIVPQNYETALAWYKKGETQKKNSFTRQIKETEELIQRKKNTDILIDNAQRTRNSNLLIQYGQQLIDGQNVFRKEQLGLKFLIKAANLGSTEAKTIIAKNYYKEGSELYSYGFAQLWYYRANKDQDPDIKTLLIQKLKEFSTETTHQENDAQTLPNLSEIPLRNNNIHQTLPLLEVAAAKNNEQALLALVILCAQGKDVPKDQNKARFYLVKILHQHSNRWFFKMITFNINHAQNSDDYIKAQILLDSFEEKLHNDAKLCNEYAEQDAKKGLPMMMCEHGLVDQPLYQAIHGLSGVIAIKLHRSRDEIQNGIQQLQEYIRLLGYYEETAIYSQGIPGIILAQLYISGQYVPKDYRKAKTILETAFKYKCYNNLQAMYLLGKMYQQGLGMKKDLKTANDYFIVACLHDNEDACHTLKANSKKH